MRTPTDLPFALAHAAVGAARERDAAARERMLETLDALDARCWLGLDATLRRYRSWGGWPGGGRFDPLRALLAACHRNGRIREAAVRRLADVRGPAALTVLAIRCADWVPELRAAARAALPSDVDGRGLVALVDAALALGPRREGGWLFERILADLGEHPHLGALLGAAPRPVRRAGYAAAIAAGRLPPETLVTAARCDPDPTVRLACAQSIVDSGDPRVLLTARSASVRALALRALDDPTAAAAALTDRHRRVRTAAQETLRRAGADPAERYRRLATHTPPAPAVLDGLGETGDERDAGIARQGLAHPRARGRVAALRALRRFGASRPADLLPLLHDGSPAVVRQAVTGLRHTPEAVPPALLADLLAPENPAHVRLAGFRLSAAGDAWQRLATDLRLVDDADERLRGTARADIASWLAFEAARVYHGPAPERAAELDGLLARAQAALGPERLRLLRFHAGLSVRP
ncbi:hypothetical protein Val02_60740 [Virgisporangium aliadipatigenens]|uniref:HEAT repeat domain-containing protein n=1 Tax=Virgisporangium aliadipatigenens TaxID=741659 RepID=A0A8J3YRQ7_9ACTN|nr:hypothetical protein [Virgisporangium aliadipatigenens]GIJ49188.1 hypothetical protein Val02_60740 [Virgisporangium aliadipatigenens]